MGTDEGVRALLVFGSNPVISAPRAGHIEQRFAALDFLVVADFFLSETAALADVVLPSAQWAEEDGTMTNLEGRVVLRQRAAAPPRGVRTDLDIIAALARPARTRRAISRPIPKRSSRSCAAPPPAASPTTLASPTSACDRVTACSGPARQSTTRARRTCF